MGHEIIRALNRILHAFCPRGADRADLSFTFAMTLPHRILRTNRGRKRTNSAFIGTDLERSLRAAGIDTLVITGVSTNNSVEATVCMAGKLGFRAYLVDDACSTFARPDFHGRMRSADEVHSMSLANLDGEYCKLVNTSELLAGQQP